MLQDRLQRPLHDLRLSVIDRCNLRCGYCMPPEQIGKDYQFLPANSLMTFEQIIDLVASFSELGVRKLRLTGGEPLLRPRLDRLVRMLKGNSRLQEIALTTNGLLLPKHAKKLKAAGLDRITVSLDEIDEQGYHQATNSQFKPEQVLAGIESALEAGFEDIKVNVVVIKGQNDRVWRPMLDTFRHTRICVRFIEFMDVGTQNDWQSSKVLSNAELKREIEQVWPLIPAVKANPSEVANRYRFEDGAGEVGFISSISQPFCQHCNRARVSANAQLFTCLFGHKGVDLKPYLAHPEQLKQAITDVWMEREDRYSERRAELSKFKQDKIEMFTIGG